MFPRQDRIWQIDAMHPGKHYIPPPSPHFWPGGHVSGRGGGVYILKPPRGRNFIRPPSFIPPPPLEGYFQGLGGVYKIWPRIHACAPPPSPHVVSFSGGGCYMTARHVRTALGHTILYTNVTDREKFWGN